ncbi:MAG: DMT family transporter [Gammaproteobacteria bacterium]|nr:DMT family transporter [Gammaproteobacteria bacterium]MCW5583263.1 DMT family transporter [Gammaproteobacteria bacterium]
MWLTFAILAAILWGLNYALAEKILQNISPVTLLALEMLVGAICFISISFFTDLKADLITLATQPKIRWLTIAEVLVVLIASYFIVISIHRKDATVAGIVELIYPLFIIFFTWLFFHENHLNIPVLIGGTLILIGVFVISFA